MQHRGVVSPHGLFFFLIASLFILGLFVVPAVAQDDNGTDGADGSCPGAREVETLTGTASDSTSEFNISGTSFRIRYNVTRVGNSPLTIRVLDENGGVVDTLRVDQEGTGSFLVNEGPGTFVVKTVATGADYTITVEDCTQSGQQGDGGNTAGDNNANPAETQYNADGKEVTVIVETIPDKRILVDTGGPTLPMIGGLILALGLVGLGIFLPRRT